MWAVNGKRTKRHLFGRGQAPIALCGYEGYSNLDYTQVHLERCSKCLELVGKRRVLQHILYTEGGNKCQNYL